MPEQCEFVRENGQRCRGRALAGGRLCTFHDPQHAAGQQQARRQGGRARSRGPTTLPTDTPALPLGTVGEVREALAATVNDVRTGRLGAREGNCLSVLLSVLLRAIEGSDLERQLDEIRAQLGGRA